MSWYGNYNQSSRQLDTLLESKPSLASLLMSSDFAQQLKSFNAKLIQYITSSSAIPAEIVTYISVPPSESDSVDRKYKLPLLTIQMMETESACILTSLLKKNGQGSAYLLSMFDMLKSSDVLPLLAGYFYRANLAICRSNYKEVLELVFSSKQYLELLIEHSYLLTISDCLTLFLCVQSSKNIALGEDKIAIKMGVVRSIISKIMTEKNSKDERSKCIVFNLCLVLKEIVERYYLNAHGKQMLQIVLQDKNVEMIVALMAQNSDNSFPAMTLILSFLKYYSLSAYNSEQGNEEMVKKNMERLELQPFIRIMESSFKNFLDQVRKEKTISLYSFNVLEVLCHCITLSSNKILIKVKESDLFPTLIELMFRNEQNNILHKLIERTLSHIFITDKNIYEKYKEYLFIEISIIDLTAKRLLQMFPDSSCLEKAKSKSYFGVLMKIIKIYSSILTTNQKIREAISSRTQLWRQMSKKIIKPYEQGHKEEMSKYQNVPDTLPIEFTVKKIQNDLMPRLIQNADILEEVKREEETMPKTLQLSDKKETQGQTLSETKLEQVDTFFKSPLDDFPSKKKTSGSEASKFPSTSEIEKEEKKQQGKPISEKSLSFSQFLNKEKVKVGEEIKLQRSMSGQKKLSADKKTRLASPSPSRKKNSWKEQQGDGKAKIDQETQQSKTKPRIPVNKLPIPNSMSKSGIEQTKVSEEQENKRLLSLSMMELECLKKVKIQRINETVPQKKTYTKAKPRDMPFFSYLGLKF